MTTLAILFLVGALGVLSVRDVFHVIWVYAPFVFTKMIHRKPIRDRILKPMKHEPLRPINTANLSKAPINTNPYRVPFRIQDSSPNPTGRRNLDFSPDPPKRRSRWLWKCDSSLWIHFQGHLISLLCGSNTQTTAAPLRPFSRTSQQAPRSPCARAAPQSPWRWPTADPGPLLSPDQSRNNDCT